MRFSQSASTCYNMLFCLPSVCKSFDVIYVDSCTLLVILNH